MSLTTLCVAQLFYAEINQSDWLLKVKWLVLTNQTTLCQHIIDYGTKKIITSTPVHRQIGNNFPLKLVEQAWPIANSRRTMEDSELTGYCCIRSQTLENCCVAINKYLEQITEK